MISELSNIEKEDPKTINKMKDAKRHNFNKLVLICDDENYTTCLTLHKPRRATLRTVSAPAATLVRSSWSGSVVELPSWCPAPVTLGTITSTSHTSREEGQRREELSRRRRLILQQDT